MYTPAITIGIMAYNNGKFIKQAIESVVCQSFTNWELIISDDASQDDTQQIVAGYLADPRIKYVKHPFNLGQGRNWAYLLQSGIAPIFAVLHADDYWLQGILANAIGQFQDENTDMICYNWYRQKHNEDQAELGPNKQSRYATGLTELNYQLTYNNNTFLPSAVFLRRTVIEKVGQPNLTLKIAVDTEYFIRVCLKAKFVRVIKDPLLVYRLHENSATNWAVNNRYTYNEREYFTSLVISHLHTMASAKARKRLINKFKKNTAMVFTQSAINEISEGNMAVSQAYLKKAIKYDKGIVLNFKFFSGVVFTITGHFGCNMLQIFRMVKVNLASVLKL